MRLKVWVLDLDHEVIDGRSMVRIWGITGEGNRVVLLDEFHPYFYLIIDKGIDVDSFIKRFEGHAAPGFRVELNREKLRFRGVEAESVKVVCRNPEELQKLSSTLQKAEGVVETSLDDLRPTILYMMDKGLCPCAWITAEVEPIEYGFQPAYRLILVEDVNLGDNPPPLRLMCFKVFCLGSFGTPSPDSDPVLMISANRWGEFIQFELKDGEGELIQKFIDYVRSVDPDVMAGFGSNVFDVPYLLERGSRINRPFKVSRAGSEPHQSVYGHFSVAGRLHVDLKDLVEDIQEIELKDLDSAAEFFGIPLLEKVEVSEFEAEELWRSRRDELRKRERMAVEVVREMLMRNMDFMITLSQLTGLPLDHVLTAAVGFRVDSYLVKEAFHIGELPPRRREQRYMAYTGGLVLKPKPGVHENIAVMDFKSMYPTLMLRYNISPDTLVEENPPPEAQIEGLPYGFKRDKPGLYASAISKLLNLRAELKRMLSRLEGAEARILAERERAVKVLTNAIYGYAGWPGARWYCREVAEATAHLGREMIKKVVNKCHTMGLEVIYGDTDSVFVKHDASKLTELGKWVEEEFKLEIKVDKIYRRLMFTESKKKYAGLTEGGSVDIVGMEAVRSDWPQAARNAQRSVLTAILRSQRHEEALRKAREAVLNLKTGKVEKGEWIIWKAITKPLEEYVVKAPHVEVARKLVEKGWKMKPGGKVGYIIKRGAGRLHEKAAPYMEVRMEEVDREYYVENLVIPAVMRALTVLGFTRDDLEAKPETRRLTDF
ncbi:MAG: DNA-directed DNA polymerase [Candidatus Bathyarchaeia archaeon]